MDRKVLEGLAWEETLPHLRRMVGETHQLWQLLGPLGGGFWRDIASFTDEELETRFPASWLSRIVDR